MSDTSIGTPGYAGIDGNAPGVAGTPGGPGGPADAAYSVTNPSGSSGRTYARGGNGGVGGNGGSGAGTGGAAGAGGAGGTAAGLTRVRLTNGGSYSNYTRAAGGIGGSAGTPGNAGTSYSGAGANGGDGGSAYGASTVTTTGGDGTADARVSIAGGDGGGGYGAGQHGGAGGVASDSTAMASGYSAFAAVSQFGGYGGRGDGGASGGAGASSTLYNAATGTTTSGGTLNLYQSASGGGGGNSTSGAGGAAGAAYSSLGFDDITADGARATYLNGSSTADGGVGGASGGAFDGANGGAATAISAVTGAGRVRPIASASGGNGGRAYGSGNGGAGGAATASAAGGSSTGTAVFFEGAQATAAGGYGGDAGYGSGGAGGTATATAFYASDTGNNRALATADAKGGSGGIGYGAGSSGGAGGVASGSTAKAFGYSAYATVSQGGGNGGTGDAGAAGGAGAASTLVNAATGASNGGTLGLYQIALGGSGGWSSGGAAGQGGRHSFDLVIPGGLSGLQPQQIRVMREADGAELEGSPITLPALSSLDGEAAGQISELLAGLASEDEENRALDLLSAETERLLARRAARQDRRVEREALSLFRRRWGREPAAEEAARAEGDELHALVVDLAVPLAHRDAGSVAILSHIRALRALGYRVCFVAADEMGRKAELAELAAAEDIEVCARPHYGCVEDVLRLHGGAFNLVYLHRQEIADRYLSLARRHLPKARIAFSVADLQHVRFGRQAMMERRPELLAYSRHLAGIEGALAARADIVLTHSPAEAEILRKVARFGRVHVVPFAAGSQPVRPPFAERHGLVFIGSSHHAPNADAVHFLVHEIMKLVWAAEPGLTCRIVGHGWQADRIGAADPRIEVSGKVDDLAEVFGTARLTVAPLRFGAGIKGKVLESFAAGLPCVMTPLAAEGLGLSGILGNQIAEGPAALAALILRLHRDEAFNAGIGREAVRMIASRHGQPAVNDAMAVALQTAGRSAAAKVAAE